MRGPAEGAGTLYCGAPRVSGLSLKAAEAGDPRSWGASSFPKPARQVCCSVTTCASHSTAWHPTPILKM